MLHQRLSATSRPLSIQTIRKSYSISSYCNIYQYSFFFSNAVFGTFTAQEKRKGGRSLIGRQPDAQAQREDAMNTVLLTQSGKLIHQGSNVADNLLPYLNHAVSLVPELTLRAYFCLLERYPMLVELNRFFEDKIAEYRQCDTDNCCTPEFNHLEFGKSVEMIGYPGAPRLEIFTSLRGIRDKRAVALEHLSLECLLDMPLKLGKLRHVIFGDRVDLFEFDTFFNLFELIDGMAWDLSFQNRPQACRLAPA